MSIRPVDHQVTVSKSGEISKVHNQDQQRGLINQQALNNTLQSNAETRIRQVRSRDEIQKVRMQERDKQEKQQGSFQKERDKNRKGKPVPNRSSNGSPAGSSIDIRL